MPVNFPRTFRSVVAVSAILLAVPHAFGLGSDYPNDEPVGGSDAWPAGMKELVNASNRVHGFFVNAEDQLFFSGDAKALTEFLEAYLKIKPIKKHRVILHDGAGIAKSPWSETGPPCDWMLYGCPEAWLTGKAEDTAYILEVHVWTGGRLDFDQVAVPDGIEVAKDESLAALEPAFSRTAVNAR